MNINSKSCYLLRSNISDSQGDQDVLFFNHILEFSLEVMFY